MCTILSLEVHKERRLMKKDIIDLQEKLQALLSAQKNNCSEGKVADYIPALADVSANYMGVSVATIDGKLVS